MKIPFDTFVFFLCTILPVFSFFINSNNQKPGYVSVKNARSYTRTGFRAMQRKHFSRSNQKSHYNMVDSHFKVMKTAPYLFPIATYGSESRSELKEKPTAWITAPKKMPQNNANSESISTQPDLWNNKQKGKQTDNIQNQERTNIQKPLPNTAANFQYQPQAIPKSNGANHYVRETKQNFVNMNVHKTHISSDPQKVARINNKNRQVAHSLYRPEDIYRKRGTNLGVDKNLEIISTYANHTFNMTAKDDKDMTRSVDSEHEKFKAEYKNKESGHNTDDENYSANVNDNGKAKRNAISESMRKYFVSKDKKINYERKKNKEFARIGIQEDSIQPEDNPYAIFYRMHPEVLDEQENQGPIVPLEEYSSVFATNKNKRLTSDSFAYEMDVRDTKPYKNNKKVKLHKKVKNFANYRSILSFENAV